MREALFFCYKKIHPRRNVHVKLTLAEKQNIKPTTFKWFTSVLAVYTF